MEEIINKINSNLKMKKIGNVNKKNFYNRDTIDVDLKKYLNKLNQPLIDELNKNCNLCFNIINYDRINIIEDCNKNAIIDSIFYISSKYNNVLINTNIFVNNKKYNYNFVKLHNSENTNLLNQSTDINNNNSNQNIKNLKPNLDYTQLENRNTCIKSNVCDKNRYKNYNKWIINKQGIPNFYKCNYETFPEVSEKNDIFQGHRGLKGASVL